MITERKKEIPSQKVRKKEKTVKTQIWQSIKSTDNQHNEETYEITIFFPKKFGLTTPHFFLSLVKMAFMEKLSFCGFTMYTTQHSHKNYHLLLTEQ